MTRSLPLISLALILALPATASAMFLLDPFGNALEATDPTTGDGSQITMVVAASAIGGVREGSVESIAVVGNSISVGSGVATFDGTAETGQLHLIWDGTANAAWDSFTGTLGLDLTSGPEDRFVVSYDTGTAASMDIFMSLGGPAAFQAGSLHTVSGAGTLEILFSDWSIDLTDIGTIVLSVQTDGISTVNSVTAVPEPSIAWLLLAAGGLRVATRRVRHLGIGG